MWFPARLWNTVPALYPQVFCGHGEGIFEGVLWKYEVTYLLLQSIQFLYNCSKGLVHIDVSKLTLFPKKVGLGQTGGAQSKATTPTHLKEPVVVV